MQKVSSLVQFIKGFGFLPGKAAGMHGGIFKTIVRNKTRIAIRSYRKSQKNQFNEHYNK